MKPDSPRSKTGNSEKPEGGATLKKSDLISPEESREPRDVAAAAAAIDRWVDAGLHGARAAASPEAEDAQFFRRVTLEIIGRIPTYEEAVAFLESSDPDKRSRWIDELLASPLYGEHFATIWRELIAPNDGGVKKPARDAFSPWLAEQFSRNRGWDRIVRDMLTAEGKIRETPQSGFILANSENQEPQPNLLADATARLFWGVQLRCAECHDHPFAPWKQADFWGTAAFFSRVRKGYTEGKNPNGLTLTEAPPDEPVSKSFTKLLAAPGVAGPALLVPAAAGKLSGKVLKAKYLGGDETGWADEGPFRERFAQWAAGASNPWFAANAANRLWAHFFGRGLVTPLDGFHEENPPSHPELLAFLARELTESGFDLKHAIRAICHSRAYGRSSRPVDGSEREEKWISHRAVKVMRPEMLYASLSVALQPPMRKSGSKPAAVGDRAQPLPGMSRDEFVRFFSSRPDENHGSVVNQGIPQFLSLMNGPLMKQAGAGLNRFLQKSTAAGDMIDALYITAFARRATGEERRLVSDYVAAHADPRDAADGVLWTLLNSAEFVTNH